MHFVSAPDGNQIHVQERGAGKPLVFLHGWALNGRVWDYQFLDLAARFRVIVPDFRGHGRSEQSPHGYTVEAFAQDTHAALEYLDLRDVTLVGWSMGAIVAAVYARLFGAERVGRLVFVGGYAALLARGDFPGLPEPVFDQILHAAGADWPAFVHQWTSSFFAQERPAHLQAWLASMMLDTPVWLALEALAHARDLDERAFLGTSRMPALVIHGERDAIVPLELGSQLALTLAHGRLVSLPNCGHAPFLEQRAAFNQLLADFATSGLRPANAIAGERQP